MNIGIVNSWGSNRGDELMLGSLLCYLNSLDNDISITIYTNSFVDIDRYKDVQLRYWTKPADLYPNTPLRICQFRMKAGLVWERLLQPAAKKFLKHDFVISAPAGPYFGDLYKGTEGLCLFQLALCNANRIPFGVLATSAGPFLDRKRNIVRNRVLGKANFWTFRESITLELFSQLKVYTNTYVGGDLVFAHPYRNVEEFEDQIIRSGEFFQFLEFLQEKPFIIVVLNKTPYFSLKGEVVPFDAPSYAVKMGRFLQHVIDRTGCRLVILPHFYGDDKEYANIKSVIKQSGRDYDIYVLNPFYNAEVQMHLYTKAVFAISHRYHPTICAAKAECPFMCIRHQFKVDGMLRMFENPGPVVTTLDSYEKYVEAFDQAWAKKCEIKRQIQKFLPYVIKSSKKHFEILGEHLERI